MEIEMNSTPPPLANVGLHRVTVTTTPNRRFKAPKKLVSCGTDEELFVKRPQFGKMNLIEDQEMKEEDAENRVTKDLEVPNATPIAQSLMNFLMQDSSNRWIWREFGDSFVNAPLVHGKYDLGHFMEDFYPQLKTRFLPRRGWQLVRRTMGRPRLFSPAFIIQERTEQWCSDHYVPPLQEHKDPPFSEKGEYSSELLESILTVKKLLGTKKKALLEIAQKNEELEADKGSKNWTSSRQRDTKAMYQRCFETLYRVNDDIVAPMSVLHEHLEQFRKQEAEKETPNAEEIYMQCCNKAELALQFAERNRSLTLFTPFTRGLVHGLQTVLLISGELGGPNSADLLVIQDNLILHLLETIPAELSAQLKQTMDTLEPHRERIKDLYKIVPEEPTQDIQQESAQQSMD